MPDRRYNREKQNLENDNWAEQIPWERSRGPYRDYGWEKGQSELPEFRDPSNRIAPYERERVNRWRDVNWDEEHERGESNIREPYEGVGPKGYQRPDHRILDDVCERLTRHGKIDARQIQLEVKNGEVFLRGSVDSREVKRAAEQVADTVSGVKDVHNELRVQEASPTAAHTEKEQTNRW